MPKGPSEQMRPADVQRRWPIIALAAAIVLASFIALKWQTVALLTAVAFSDRRPALLSDAAWNDPPSARKFNDWFAAGASGAELVAWMKSNKFTVDSSIGRAVRHLSSLPCNEDLAVHWTTAVTGKLDDVEVRVTEAGCL